MASTTSTQTSSEPPVQLETPLQNIPGLPGSTGFNLTAPLPPHILIAPLTPTTLPRFRSTISLLLPIRYPDTFYTTILTDPAVALLARAAIWQDQPRPAKRRRLDPNTAHPSSKPRTTSSGEADTKTTAPARETHSPSDPSSNFPPQEELSPPNPHVVGGIRCRIEPLHVPPSSPMQHQLYIQALALLSPYRGHGIATHLLSSVISNALSEYPNMVSVYAHVWEANGEGLEWYRRRGFEVEEGVLEGYYRRLRPSGARVVRRGFGVRDWLRVEEGKERGGREETDAR